MRKAIALGMLAVSAAACHPPVKPEVLQQWQSRTLYTCCNIRHEGDAVSDGNYAVGAILPFGSPATVQKMTSDSITIQAAGQPLTLQHEYGRDQESADQYFGKLLVQTDPHARFASFPADVQHAITDGRVERGMTKEQVLMSLGYPPTHRTASTDLNTWTYWYNRWVTYQVQFGADGKVAMLIGNAPTNNQPIVAPTPVAAPPVKKIHRK
jgi:hypothetical protein